MALSRYEHTGDAPTTGLASGIGATDLSFTLNSGTGYPTGVTGKFVICLDAGGVSEEKVLCSARSGAAVTVATGGRGYDGTTATTHSSGTTNVTHVLSAAEIDDFSDHVYTTTRDDHTQYLRVDGTRAGTGAQTIGGALTVSSGGLTVTAGGATVTGNSTVTGTLAVTSLTQTADDAAWIAPTFTNSWANGTHGFANAGYRKVNGRIYLRGQIETGATNTSAFTLPAGYRPSAIAQFLVSSNFVSAGSTVTIRTDGTVTPQWTSPSVGAVVLDGISFDTL